MLGFPLCLDTCPSGLWRTFGIRNWRHPCHGSVVFLLTLVGLFPLALLKGFLPQQDRDAFFDLRLEDAASSATLPPTNTDPFLKSTQPETSFYVNVAKPDTPQDGLWVEGCRYYLLFSPHQAVVFHYVIASLHVSRPASKKRRRRSKKRRGRSKKRRRRKKLRARRQERAHFTHCLAILDICLG